MACAGRVGHLRARPPHEAPPRTQKHLGTHLGVRHSGSFPPRWPSAEAKPPEERQTGRHARPPANTPTHTRAHTHCTHCRRKIAVSQGQHPWEQRDRGLALSISVPGRRIESPPLTVTNHLTNPPLYKSSAKATPRYIKPTACYIKASKGYGLSPRRQSPPAPSPLGHAPCAWNSRKNLSSFDSLLQGRGLNLNREPVRAQSGSGTVLLDRPQC